MPSLTRARPHVDRRVKPDTLDGATLTQRAIEHADVPVERFADLARKSPRTIWRWLAGTTEPNARDRAWLIAFVSRPHSQERSA